jgi:hypothetical protein
MHGSIFGCSILFHWPMSLSLHLWRALWLLELCVVYFEVKKYDASSFILFDQDSLIYSESFGCLGFLDYFIYFTKTVTGILTAIIFWELWLFFSINLFNWWWYIFMFIDFYNFQYSSFTLINFITKYFVLLLLISASGIFLIFS